MWRLVGITLLRKDVQASVTEEQNKDAFQKNFKVKDLGVELATTRSQDDNDGDDDTDDITAPPPPNSLLQNRY